MNKKFKKALKGSFQMSKDFVESLTDAQSRAFDLFDPDYAERFTEAFSKSIALQLKTKLDGGELASLVLPHGTFTIEDAGDVVNVGFEFSKAALEYASGDAEKLQRMDVDEYDTAFLELFRNWVQYDGPEKVDHTTKKTWGLHVPNNDSAALILQDICAVIMSELTKYAKDGSISIVEIDNHGKYTMELNDGNVELLFEASKVFKQKGKDDSARTEG